MTLAQLLNNKNLLAEYVKWIKDPIGKIVCDVLLEEFTRPTSFSGLDKSTAEYLFGAMCGSRKMLDALRSLDKMRKNDDGELEITYEEDNEDELEQLESEDGENG